MEDALFTLIRLGVGMEEPSEGTINTVAQLNVKQWRKLRDMAEMQGVSAIVLDGIERLKAQNYGVTIALPQALLLEWIGQVMIIEQANQQQLEVMNDLSSKWAEAGCLVMVMKGQANGILYPHPNHRSTGDIDCYLMPNKGYRLAVSGYREVSDEQITVSELVEAYKRGNEIAREAGAEVDESWYKHSVISYKGETFENHQYFVHTREGKRGKRLNQELVDAVIGERLSVIEGTNVMMPPVQWNAMFLTYHGCVHFISEGLRLKQLLDWAMFLNKHQNEVDWEKFYAFCERHQLSGFVDVATAIAVNYLGITITNSHIRTESSFTERVIQSALYDEDYVFGSGKGNWHNRFHLVRNLWTYRWKYRDIYQMSPLRQLWYYASGFIFKTE